MNNSKQKTVLIVEDDKSSFQYLKFVLKLNNINHLWATNGEMAIEYCTNNSEIDLVLMDINMPVMSGYEATKRIKKIKPNLPIIAQTAYSITGDREKFINAGFNDYISKPTKKEELLKMINRYT